MEIEIHIRKKLNQHQWKLIANQVKDVAIHNENLCKSITLSFLSRDCLKEADFVFFSYKSVASGRNTSKTYKQYNGLVIIQKAKLSKHLYIDLICANGAGRFLIEQTIDWAKQKNFTHITLSSLANVIGFYRKFGFKNTFNLECVEDEMVSQFAKKYDPQNLSGNTDFLKILIRKRLVKNRECFTMDQCAIDGYWMTLCL